VTQNGNGQVSLRDSLCANNELRCDPTTGCTQAFGGCLYADSGVVLIANETRLEKNSVVGVGGGGAVMLEGSSVGLFSNSSMDHNSGQEGGGLLCSGSALAEIRDSGFTENRATTVGGAIVCILDASLRVERSRFVHNAAGSRGSAILGFNDNYRAHYVLSDVEIVLEEAENAILISGNVSASTNSSTTNVSLFSLFIARFKCHWPLKCCSL